jgi:hypothetical protein
MSIFTWQLENGYPPPTKDISIFTWQSRPNPRTPVGSWWKQLVSQTNRYCFTVDTTDDDQIAWNSWCWAQKKGGKRRDSSLVTLLTNRETLRNEHYSAKQSRKIILTEDYLNSLCTCTQWYSLKYHLLKDDTTKSWQHLRRKEWGS